MARSVESSLDFRSVARLLNLLDAVDPQEPATLAQVKRLVEGLAWKDNVRVATQANVSLSIPGTSLDGVAMAVNDRVLLRGQAADTENGIYIWNGPSTALTRALDADNYPKLESAVVTVDEGSSTGATYRQTGVNGTLGVTPVLWATFGTAAAPANETTPGIAETATQAEVDAGLDDSRFVTALKLAQWAGRIKPVAQNIGDNSATQFTVVHNLGKRDVDVSVYRNSGAYDEVIVEVERTTVNSVTVRFEVPPGLNAYRVAVFG